MKELLNCPNCGAPIEDVKCPYCGTVFIDFASMDMDKPFYLAIKHDGKVMTCKVQIENAELTTSWDDLGCCLYADGRVVDTLPLQLKQHLNVQMKLVEVDGVMRKEYHLASLRHGQPDQK